MQIEPKDREPGRQQEDRQEPEGPPKDTRPEDRERGDEESGRGEEEKERGPDQRERRSDGE